MKVIGVTGGVGAGKSTVLDYLENEYGAYVILADEVGHIVYEPGTDCHAKVVEAFGEGILDADGRIDRKKLGGIVFGNPEKLAELNDIVHPAVKDLIIRQIEEQRTLGRGVCVVEAALLLEAGYKAFCDEVWYIYTDAEVRRARLKESRGYTDERIDDIFSRQLSEQTFRELCDLTIDNSGAPEETQKKIREYMIGHLT